MATETAAELTARGFFEQLGYAVTRLERPPSRRRADYCVEDGIFRYLDSDPRVPLRGKRKQTAPSRQGLVKLAPHPPN